MTGTMTLCGSELLRLRYLRIGRQRSLGMNRQPFLVIVELVELPFLVRSYSSMPSAFDAASYLCHRRDRPVDPRELTETMLAIHEAVRVRGSR